MTEVFVVNVDFIGGFLMGLGFGVIILLAYSCGKYLGD